jgi:hypothetical protein
VDKARDQHGQHAGVNEDRKQGHERNQQLGQDHSPDEVPGGDDDRSAETDLKDQLGLFRLSPQDPQEAVIFLTHGFRSIIGRRKINISPHPGAQIIRGTGKEWLNITLRAEYAANAGGLRIKGVHHVYRRHHAGRPR